MNSGMTQAMAARRMDVVKYVLGGVKPPADNPYDAAHWQLNQARLVAGVDLEKANSYFEAAELDPRPKIWPNGAVEGADWDFPGINYLRTLLDYGGSDRLTATATKRLKGMFVRWVQNAYRNPRQKHFRDNDRAARYPVIFTENHDIMALTIGYFGEVLAGRETAGHAVQLAQSLTWRFRRGWTEWHSPCYQPHYLNALLLLADHSPDPVIRSGAADLINVQLAERAALSVGGCLGGPFCRGYDAHVEDDRNDSYLGVMRVAFGVPADDAGQRDLESHFALSGFVPHPAVVALAALPGRTSEAWHRGVRDCSTGWESLRYPVCWYNTPHVSMGSVQSPARVFQPRFFNVMFPSAPGCNLRTRLLRSEKPDPWYPRNERGEVVQYRNWLIAKGELVENGGIKPEQAGHFNLYTVGRGLCAHTVLSPDLHVFQVGDLDMYRTKAAFVEALTPPALDGSRVKGMAGDDRVVADSVTMGLTVNGKSGYEWRDELHAGPWLFSGWDSGRISIRMLDGETVFDPAALRRLADCAGGG